MTDSSAIYIGIKFGSTEHLLRTPRPYTNSVGSQGIEFDRLCGGEQRVAAYMRDVPRITDEIVDLSDLKDRDDVNKQCVKCVIAMVYAMTLHETKALMSTLAGVAPGVSECDEPSASALWCAHCLRDITDDATDTPDELAHIFALDADTALCGRKREACGSAIDAAEWDPQGLHSSVDPRNCLACYNAKYRSGMGESDRR